MRHAHGLNACSICVHTLRQLHPIIRKALTCTSATSQQPREARARMASNPTDHTNASSFIVHTVAMNGVFVPAIIRQMPAWSALRNAGRRCPQYACPMLKMAEREIIAMIEKPYLWAGGRDQVSATEPVRARS